MWAITNESPDCAAPDGHPPQGAVERLLGGLTPYALPLCPHAKSDATHLRPCRVPGCLTTLMGTHPTQMLTFRRCATKNKHCKPLISAGGPQGAVECMFGTEYHFQTSPSCNSKFGMSTHFWWMKCQNYILWWNASF